MKKIFLTRKRNDINVFPLFNPSGEFSSFVTVFENAGILNKIAKEKKEIKIKYIN